MNKVIGWHRTYEADELLCIGKDDKNIETILNIDTFIRKIPLRVERDIQGMYDPEDVKETLISKIQVGRNEKTS